MGVQDLFTAVSLRKSIRSYDGRPLSARDRGVIEAVIGDRSTPGVRMLLLQIPAAELFTGLFGAYGRISGSQDCLVMVGETAQPHVHEWMGWAGEMVILEATTKGLGSCWVSGMFKRGSLQDRIELSKGEEVMAISPLGYPAPPTGGHRMVSAMARSHIRKELTALVLAGPVPMSKAAPWQRAALEAARLAPSARNRQPWRFSLGQDFLMISLDQKRDSASKRLDCGIAMAHMEVAALASGVKGEWESLPSPNVAQYRLVK